MDDDVILLAIIQEAIRQGNYFITPHALSSHPVAEGFTPSQALEAIANGQVVERRERESRCVVSGQASGLLMSPAFVTNYIHCVCEYDRIHQIVIITMYRPSTAAWINHNRRRR